MSELIPLGPGDLVLSDFDGTITVRDTGLEVMNRVNDPAAWDLEYMWRRGEIGSQECLAAQWGLMRLTEAELFTVLDEMPLDESFPTFAALCRERGARLLIVSDGLDLYLFRLLRRLGLEGCPGSLPLAESEGCIPVFVNHGEWTPEGVRVEFPHADKECWECGNCKTRELLALRPGYRRVLYVGDGYSDMCSARHADVLFAKSHLADFCDREALPYHPFRSFADIAAVLS